jgi:glycosyltransferase involved in cell wall biosynthesis
MIECEQGSPATPHLSVIIPVYNDWIPLEHCLQSLVRQNRPPSFEVIVVDDGSVEAVPESSRSSAYPFLTIIRQAHSGIPSARNRGIRNSKGSVLLFVDADCRLEADCLSALCVAVARAPKHDCFQLRLVGDRSTLVGRAEELRLSTFQRQMVQPDNRIRYLNTAGFAIRRSRVSADGVFHPDALRGEDTLLLANLIQAGELPFFVADAVVEHSIPLSLMKCLRKDLRTVYLEGPAYDMIASTGVKIRLTHWERLRLLGSMWRAAGRDSFGRSAWFVLVIRQAFQRIASVGYRYVRRSSGILHGQL